MVIGMFAGDGIIGEKVIGEDQRTGFGSQETGNPGQMVGIGDAAIGEAGIDRAEFCVRVFLIDWYAFETIPETKFSRCNINHY
jgi:hypothetical protein